jgi:hypothetical protein
MYLHESEDDHVCIELKIIKEEKMSTNSKAIMMSIIYSQCI